MASVTINFMREKVAELYPRQGWKDRVMNYMPDRQVMAIYHRAIEQNMFNRNEKEDGVYHQMTLAEYMSQK